MSWPTLRVTKMSGAGNDFLVLGPEERVALGDRIVEWVRLACRRGLSLGADGVLVVEPLGRDRVRVVFRNPDGSEAFCGNGSRCAARFAQLRGMAGERMRLETLAGEVPAEIDGSRVRLLLPAPQDRGAVVLEAGGQRHEGQRIDAGCPHFVRFVDDIAGAPLERWGPAIRGHALFSPTGVNVDLVRRHEDRLLLRTWERGVEGETLACGSGAVAAALAARLTGAPPTVRVVPASGIPLTVELPGDPQRPELAVLTGDARVILEGRSGPETVSGS